MTRILATLCILAACGNYSEIPNSSTDSAPASGTFVRTTTNPASLIGSYTIDGARIQDFVSANANTGWQFRELVRERFVDDLLRGTRYTIYSYDGDNIRITAEFEP